MDAESVRELMFAYFHAMRGAIERHGDTVEKFVGDAVMAVSGVPVAHEDDALRAVTAAWEMRRRLDDLNEDLERRYARGPVEETLARFRQKGNLVAAQKAHALRELRGRAQVQRERA